MQMAVPKEWQREKLVKLRNTLGSMSNRTQLLTLTLLSLADEMDEVFKKVKIFILIGASAAIIGGVLAGLGYVVPSFFSYGWTFAGGIIAGIGAATIGGAQMFGRFHSSKKSKAAEKVIKEYSNIFETSYYTIVSDSETLLDIDNYVIRWLKLAAILVYRDYKTGKNIHWDVIGSTIKAFRAIAEGFARGVSNASSTPVGVTTAWAVHFMFGVVGILLIPVDAYTLYATAIDVHKKTPHTVSEQLRETARTLKNENPKQEDVDRFIEKALRNLRVVKTDQTFSNMFKDT